MVSKKIAKSKYGINAKMFLYFAFIFFFIFSCNQTFEPRQENSKYYFSMYGFLDASADTQWVRISPARQDYNLPTEGLEMKVTLEHLESGTTVTMKDSLFTSGNYLNYWTTTDIENEQSYQIKAVRSDGKSSQVTVTIPKELPTPRTLPSDNPAGYDVFIDDSIEHLADVQSKYYYIIDPQGIKQKRTYTFSYRNEVEQSTAFGGSYTVFINMEKEKKIIRESNPGGNSQLLTRQILVAAGGPEWIDEISGLDDTEYFLNDTASNVENGLGYVVGIDTKWIPYLTCYNDQFAVVPCKEQRPYW